VVKTRKVILWGREDLLGSSVEILLSGCTGWEVIRLFSGQNENRLYQAIEQEKPDVVLLYPESCQDNDVLPMRVIQCYPGIKVININLNSEEVDIYSKQKVSVHTLSDLLGAFED
jgi:hypothetical protein